MEFLEKGKDSLVIDVRSPDEYKSGHIPDAVNIPLFSNEERAIVGTAYAKEGKEKAILLGLDLVGSKLSAFIKEVKELKKSKNVLIYCWRGGMRSASMAWLLELAGMNCFILEKGYKSFRKHVLESYKNISELIILGGMTGSGKTEILKELALKGIQTIDLEKLAHHKGSAFGHIGEDPQPSNEQFENDIFDQLSKLNLLKSIWVEDESRLIGRNQIPEDLWKKMRVSEIVVIEISQELRAQNLTEKYQNIGIEDLQEAIMRLQKRLGESETKKIYDLLSNQEFFKAASALLKYYDKAYNFDLSNRKSNIIKIILSDTVDSQINALKVIKSYKQ